MSNTYPNSVIPVRTSFYFNGYSYYPYERCPSSYFYCSCSIPLNNDNFTLLINPNSLYGLRQSTLIQLPPSRRLVLGFSYRSPGYNVGGHFCGECCCIKQERVGRFVKKSCKEECCVKKNSVSARVDEIRSRLGRSNYRCSALGDVDGMIDLLMENSIEDVSGRKGGSFEDEKVIEKINDANERSKERDENSGLEGEMQRIEGMKVFSRDENRRSRRGESSSSNHSVLDSGVFESDLEVQTKHRRIDGVSLLKNEKGSRKSGGTVIKEESQKTKRDSETYRDWRKKSEKKLSEESTEENKSSNVSSVRQSQFNQSHEINSTKSSSKERLNYQEGESSSGVSFHGQSNSNIKAASEYLKSSNSHEQSMQADMNESQIVDESSQQMGYEYCVECGEIMQQSKTQTHIQQHGELSENQEDMNEAFVVQNQFESRLRKQDNNSNSLQSSGMEVLSVQNEPEIGLKMEGQSSTSLQTLVKEENNLQMGNKSLNYGGTVDTHGWYGASSSRSQRQSESEMKNLEDYSTSVISRQEKETRGKVIKEIESNKELQTVLNASQLHSTSVEINRQSMSRQRIHNEQAYSTIEVKSVKELLEKHKQISETNVQTRNSIEEITVTQPSSMSLISQTGVDQVNTVEIQSSLQISMISPFCQFVGSSPPYLEPSINLLSNDNASNTELDTIGTTVQPQEIPVSSYDEVIRSEGKSFKEPCPEHACSEFVEDTNHEPSTSKTKIKDISKHDSMYQDEKYMIERCTISKSEKTKLQKQDSRPLGEMWFVKDQLPPESSEIESSEGATSGDVVNRTGKSLWNIIARVFRLRCVSRSETQTSPVKSGGWKSSHESASSETWVYGKEKNEATADSLEDGQKSLAQKLISSDQALLKEKATRTKMGSLGVMGSDEITNVKVGSSLSSSVLQTGLLLGVVSAVSNANWNFAQQMPQLTPSDSSKNPSRRSRKSCSSVKIEEFDQNEGIVSSKEEQSDQSLNVRQTDVSTAEIIEVEPKNGKLKRSKQVLEEKFDRWEDAYKHENEQRRADEIFMREALVEAKKAADSWEVPVGAVLVQNGKIIARGYNLVEELRDSTAHAEIICIREGSSVLRTWRLSETTLYVTLEPCPMCSGAILQARVGAIVWGAPNKLLGADGSWIRLFPAGAEEEQRPEVANKAAAPIHPFHPNMKIRRGVLEPECADIMQQFFQLRRRNKKKKQEETAQPSCLPIPHHPSKILHKLHHIFHIIFCL